MSAILITTCTNRKLRPAKTELQARNLPAGSLEHVAADWYARVSNSSDKFPTQQVYCGRSYSEAVSASDVLSSPLYVISAGLGLVQPNEDIPPYDLTTARSSKDRIQSKVTKGITSAQWWRALNSVKGISAPIATLVRESKPKLVLVGLSASYLDMVQGDLETISDQELGRVRIVGIRRSNSLSKRIQSVLMPYDERFDGPDTPIPGTRGDFAQRALRHFCELLSDQSQIALDVDGHKVLVSDRLKKMRHPKVITRKPVKDEELIQLVAELWERANGHSSKMLRILRDEELVACEQGRFASLFKKAKAVHGLT